MTLSPRSLAGPGYVILNGIRVVNIISLLAVIAASVVALVKIVVNNQVGPPEDIKSFKETDFNNQFFFFEAVTHVITAFISSKSNLTLP